MKKNRILILILTFLLFTTINSHIFFAIAQSEEIKPPDPILEERYNWDVNADQGIYHVSNSIHLLFDIGPNLDFEANVINATDWNHNNELFYQHNIKLKY